MAIERNPNLQVKQSVQDLPPSEGSEGFVGAETGPAVGLKVVSGKKGYVKTMPVWGETSSGADQDTAVPDLEPAGSDSTDEKAGYKKIQTDEGLPQTYRDSFGAGDAGVEGSDEMNEDTGPREETQSVPSADAGDHDISMPQTGFTHSHGGGAPLFKKGS